MQILKSLSALLLLIFPFISKAQTTYLPEGAKEYQFIDRLEIKQGNFTDLNYSTIKPYSRKAIVEEAEYLDSGRLENNNSLTGNDTQNKWAGLNLSKIDEYNIQSILMNNSEWVSGSKESFLSKHPILKSFYVTKPNLLEVNVKDFFLAVNPVISFQVGKESSNDETLFYNKRGATARGMIANRIGFSTTLTDNQERGPLFFQNRVRAFNAVPGVGFYKPFKTTGYDYFDARGYVTFNATKYINIQFGYDKNFIGNGYRSLFLSDFGNSYLFLKLNTRIWKFNYENLFMELMPQFFVTGDNLLDRKYAAMHHLSMNVTRWLNVGLFEGVIFGRKNRFDFEYLNPIIFLRHIEGTVGSPDNAVAGIDFKANFAHHFQVYGQLLLDEFILKEVTKGNGFWANKYAYQLGAKYVDAFNLKNLDLQFEANRVRPFTYSHNDSIANYTHYNLPLAHPLGANFQEFIGILKYQPAAKWYLNARAIYYYQGLDSAGENFGSNPFESYATRIKDYGFDVGGGSKVKVFNAAVALSYELKENLFLEGSLLFRKYTGQGNRTLFGIGVRWNAARRDYDY
ncbi:MAG: capsule assembly Wzi family protein [Bacteroidota bacterium]|nr:capsule assembly Wzi family protein [Bacteroidota bacterium]